MSSVRIAIIQTTLFWEDKQANLNMLESKIQELDASVQLVILPEMFSTGFSMNAKTLAETMDGKTMQWMQALSSKKRIIIIGSLIIEEEGKFYNRLIWMMPNGNMGYYDKRHLFAYAGEDKHYHAGQKRLIASVNGIKINLQICYDLRFPVWARPQDEEEYDVLIYVANWPEKRSHAWKSLLTARAIENQCYVVGVNRVGKDGLGNTYCGDSSVIDPMGQIIYQKAEAEEVFVVTLEKSVVVEVRNKLPFLRDADRFRIEEE
jgi:omega-amidase